MSLLDVKDLSVAFTHSGQLTTVVKGISFCVNSGETMALVGESGSGKSVSALAIMRLLPQPAAHITGGSIEFEGQDLLKQDVEELRRIRGSRIAIIFQEPMTALNPVQKIGVQLAEVLRLHKPDLSTQAIYQRCIVLLQHVEINEVESRLQQYPHELSGGMRQRVMIAMAIACEPALLIADEPTTALDVTIQREVMDLLQRLQQKMGMAILLISHDLALVKHYADYISVMYQGELLEQACSEALFKQPKHAYTQQLLATSNTDKAVAVGDDSQELIRVQDLNVHFALSKGFFGDTKQSLHAVNNASFSLKKGHTLGIVGESGSGKSTLIKALLRLNKSSGSICFNGRDISGLSQKQLRPLRKHIQIVLQDPFGSLSPKFTVEQIIAEGLDIHTDLNKAEKQQRVMQALQEVSIDPELRSRHAHEFSGGQRQRIAIARALVMNPDVIVLDEPTSALDRTIQVQIVELLKDLQQKHQLSYVFVSHDLNVVKAISHHVAVMQAGKIIEYGETDQVLQSPQQTYTQTLLEAAFY